MNWTKEKPQKHGFYWFRTKKFVDPIVVRVYVWDLIPGEISIYFPGADSHSEEIKDFPDAEWYGPLESPIDKT
jgi:hypothetical protein